MYNVLRSEGIMINELVLENQGLVYYVVNRYYKHNKIMEREDIIQTGYLGLVKAAHKFDKSKGVKFSTFATTTIWGEISRYIRDFSGAIGSRKDKMEDVGKLMPFTFSMLTEYDSDDYKNSLLMSLSYEMDINKILISTVKDKLTEEERYLLEQLEVKKQKEIAEEFGCSQVNISRKIKKLKQKVKRIIGDLE